MKRISYSAIKRFENCPASYLYYVTVPRMEFFSQKDTSLFGRKFHEWAEKNFNPDDLDSVIPENEVDHVDLDDMAISIRGRDYFNLPAINEPEISVVVPPGIEVWGFPDRICLDFPNRRIYIIDYKTAFEPDPIADIKQLQMYAYIILNNKDLRQSLMGKVDNIPDKVDKEELEEWFVNSLLPEQFYLLLDYVKNDYQYPYEMNTSRFLLFERYLFGVLRRISDVEKEFYRNFNMNKVTHIDGNCNFCMMSGYCIPYRIISNSYYDTEFDRYITEKWQELQAIPVSEGITTVEYPPYDAGTLHSVILQDFCDSNGIEYGFMLEGEIHMSTMGLIAEYQERQRISSINDNRLKALSRTLLSRIDSGDEVVARYFRRQRNSITSYPASDILKEVIPHIVKDVVKDVRFQGIIDVEHIKRELHTILGSMLNANIRKSNIPEKYRKDIDKYKVVKYTNPFLKTLK